MLALTSDTRLTQFPQTPTIAESGTPGYEYRGWVVVMAPVNLPRPILERVHAEIIKSVESADTRKRMEHLEPWTMKPEQTAARVRADYEKTGRLIAQVGAKADQ